MSTIGCDESHLKSSCHIITPQTKDQTVSTAPPSLFPKPPYPNHHTPFPADHHRNPRNSITNRMSFAINDRKTVNQATVHKQSPYSGTQSFFHHHKSTAQPAKQSKAKQR
jgi:hypothetical protein